MRTRHRSSRGSSVLYVIVLSPLLMFCIALGLEAGALQLEKSRLTSAADVATESASSQISQSGDGTVGLDPQLALSTTRQDLSDNLIPLENLLAGESAGGVANDAEIYAVTTTPAPNPFVSGELITRPTLTVRMRVPVASGLLGMVGLPAIVTLNIVSSADLRITGVAS